MTNLAALPSVSAPVRNTVPIGRHPHGLLELDLDWVLAGRMLLQGGSGAGKSRTMRRIVEEAFDYVQTMIVDPEGEFGNLAAHIGATTLKAAEIAADGLTAAATRARHHRIALHLDLTDLDPEQRIIKASAFFAGLVSAPREDWKHTVLVAIDEAHLLAPHHAGSARDAETRRLGVATLTDLCARGRKRGVAPIIATQRLAKLSSSVVSELQNFLIGLNVFDRDIARAADILGFSRSEAEKLRTLAPGDFFALGPALSRTPVLGHIDPTITAHVGATPELHAAAVLDRAEAERLLDLSGLREAPGMRDEALKIRGTRALDAFLLDEAGPIASAICLALKTISPNATTSDDLARHLGATPEAVDQGLDVLSALAAIDTMPRGEGRMARLHARLRAKLSDVPVVALS